MATDAAVIDVQNVIKAYGGHIAVDDVSFSVQQGQVFGMIGPSGSGKTTLVLMMVGISVPTSGDIRGLGIPPAGFPSRVRARIGYMPQASFLYPSLTSWENLSHVAGLFGMGWLAKRRVISRLLRELGLWDSRDKQARELSGGMLRRLQLAAVLVHDPDLAFIDEPMEGLDPILRQEVWEILQGMRARGKTVVMTTHNMNEAERCDNLMTISEGRLLAVGTPPDLRRRAFGGDIIRVLAENVSPEVYGALHSIPGVKHVTVLSDTEVRLVAEDADAVVNQAVQVLQRLGSKVTEAERFDPPFDDVFAAMVRNG